MTLRIAEELASPAPGRCLIVACVAALCFSVGFAGESARSPADAKTIDDIAKAIEAHKGFGHVQTAQFSRWGRQVFAAWYCPFSGRNACYLHAYYYDYSKAQWIRFLDQLVQNNHDLSAEMPIRDEVVIFRGVEGEIAVKASVAKFPQKMRYDEQK